MLKIQGKDFSYYLENVELKLVRTYKGEVARTLTGVVVTFPAFFITVGFSLTLMGPRAEVILAQQLLLSANTVKIVSEYNGTTFEGNFSATSVNVVEVRDKKERSLRLTCDIVSDGTDITKVGGAKFSVKYGETTLLSNCSFGKVYALESTPQYKLNGADLPGNKILVLGDTVVTTV
jgi:hypothetical protein